MFFAKRAALSYDTFDSLIAGSNEIRCVKLNEANWKLSICNYVYFCKHYNCVHILAVALLRDLHVLDPRASQIQIEQNRPRGRLPGMELAYNKLHNLPMNANPDVGVPNAVTNLLAQSQPERRGRKPKKTTANNANNEAAAPVVPVAPIASVEIEKVPNKRGRKANN